MRDFQIFGESLVTVLGNGALAAPRSSSSPEAGLWELGLTSEKITITPRFYHQEIHCDDFGHSVPAELMWNLADVNIRMTLIHYDSVVLNDCFIESMAGGKSKDALPIPGTMAACGTMMGGYKDVGEPGCHYISLNIISALIGGDLLGSQLPDNWHFRAAYISTPPLEIPIGTEKTIVVLNWRAIPYVSPSNSNPSSTIELKSQGNIVWDEDIDNGEILNPFVLAK
jgi:hypothetical protein